VPITSSQKTPDLGIEACNMGFSSKMHDNLRPFNKVIDKIHIIQIAVPEFESALNHGSQQEYSLYCRIGQRIKYNNSILRILIEYVPNKITAINPALRL